MAFNKTAPSLLYRLHVFSKQHNTHKDCGDQWPSALYYNNHITSVSALAEPYSAYPVHALVHTHAPVHMQLALARRKQLTKIQISNKRHQRLNLWLARPQMVITFVGQ